MEEEPDSSKAAEEACMPCRRSCHWLSPTSPPSSTCNSSQNCCTHDAFLACLQKHEQLDVRAIVSTNKMPSACCHCHYCTLAFEAGFREPSPVWITATVSAVSISSPTCSGSYLSYQQGDHKAQHMATATCPTLQTWEPAANHAPESRCAGTLIITLCAITTGAPGAYKDTSPL